MIRLVNVLPDLTSIVMKYYLSLSLWLVKLTRREETDEMYQCWCGDATPEAIPLSPSTYLSSDLAPALYSHTVIPSPCWAGL